MEYYFYIIYPETFISYIVCCCLLNFDNMLNRKSIKIVVTNHVIKSTILQRDVLIDFYLPTNLSAACPMSLLLINDGQDLATMQFNTILETLHQHYKIKPLLCVGIHCGADRKNEYATASVTDYKGRGVKAAAYTRFIFEELLPFVQTVNLLSSFVEIAFAGFSLGGLSALDIVWNNAETFTKAGVFSGALWWRNKDQADADFDETQHRIMHRQVRDGNYVPALKFFFEAGEKDETADRNQNGIIDSIDDTLDLIEVLKNKGYTDQHITYLQLEEGRHDLATWAIALPVFLQWGWSEESFIIE